MQHANDSRLTPLQNFVADVLSGLLARTLTSPFEVVKTIQQIGTAEGGDFFSTVQNIWAIEGFWGFFKANLARIIRSVPFSAARTWFANHGVGVYYGFDLSSLAATLVSHPLVLVKTRLTQQLTTAPMYSEFPAVAAVQIASQDGLTALWSGVVPALFHDAITNWIESFSKRKFRRLTSIQAFARDTVIGSIAQLVALPTEIISVKLQAQSRYIHGAARSNIECDGVIDCASKMIRSGGVTSFFTGTFASILKILPYFYIEIVAFDVLRKFFVYYNGYIESPFSETPKKNVPQHLSPAELKKWLKANPNPDIKKSQ